jgi:DUF1680 family protein
LYTYADQKQSSYSVKVNGETVNSQLTNGYFGIERKWEKGDKIEISFDMQPRTVKAHPEVEADRGRVSFERGPVVYCAEWPDNDFDLPSIQLPAHPEIQVADKPAKLNGIKELSTQAQSFFIDAKGRFESKTVTLTLIPYYAWNHRGAGQMAVWLPQEMSAVIPAK